MMAVGLLQPSPRRIVQLGLGAAALTKFCFRHLPEAELIAVELSVEVIAVARSAFRLPPDDGRLTVVEADAREFISDPRRRGCADWLQVDLYDAAARGPVHDDVDFYRACRRALSPSGVACFNLFGRRFDPSFAAISEAFRDRAMVLPEIEHGNRIVIAVASAVDLPFSVIYERALELEARWKLPARRWVAGLRAANGFDARLEA
jgi:spermidine synthase